MKKLNLYYIVSIATLAIMMVIFVRTLHVNGWFEEYQGKTPAQWVYDAYQGIYKLQSLPATDADQWVSVTPSQLGGEANWLNISIDSHLTFQIRINDFEDEQILIEIYRYDSTAVPQRLEGCELLLDASESEQFSGSTIGDFCGFNPQSTEYLALELLLQESDVSLQVQRGVLGNQDSLNTKKYLLERVIHGK